MSDENIFLAESMLVLQKLEGGLHILQVIWVLRSPELTLWGVIRVLGEIWVWAQAVVYRSKSSYMGLHERMLLQNCFCVLERVRKNSGVSPGATMDVSIQVLEYIGIPQTG
jgi:hypothetical protein